LSADLTGTICTAPGSGRWLAAVNIAAREISALPP
jgi:hypothetical protein